MSTEVITLVGIALNVVSAMILLTTVIIMAVQIKEMRRATHATAFKAVFDMIQTDDIRKARRLVLEKLKDKSFKVWTTEQRHMAEEVCSSYDAVAIMTRNGLIPVRVIASNWNDSICRTWRILSPLVYDYRKKRNCKKTWANYEWLASQAEKYQ